MKGGEYHFFQILRNESVFSFQVWSESYFSKSKEVCNLPFFFLVKHARLVQVSQKNIEFHPHNEMLKTDLSFE